MPHGYGVGIAFSVVRRNTDVQFSVLVVLRVVRDN